MCVWWWCGRNRCPTTHGKEVGSVVCPCHCLQIDVTRMKPQQMDHARHGGVQVWCGVRDEGEEERRGASSQGTVPTPVCLSLSIRSKPLGR